MLLLVGMTLHEQIDHLVEENTRLQKLLELAETKLSLAETRAELAEAKVEAAEKKTEAALSVAAYAEASVIERAEAAGKEAVCATTTAAKTTDLPGDATELCSPDEENDSFAWFFSCFEDYVQLSEVSDDQALKMALFKSVHDGSDVIAPDSKDPQKQLLNWTYEEYKQMLKQDAGIRDRNPKEEQILNKLWTVLETLVPDQKLEHGLDKLKTKVMKELDRKIALEGFLSKYSSIKQAIEQTEGMEKDVSECAPKMFLMNDARVKYKFRAMFRLLLIL